VTGANDGIGLEIVKLLAAAGGKVFLGSRSVEKGQAAHAKLPDAVKGRVTVVQLDVGDDASVNAAVETIKAAGGVDVLVNNAGLGGMESAAKQRPNAPLDMNVLQQCMDVNFFGTVRVTHAFVPLLSASSAPAILFVSSDMASTTMMATAVGNPQSPLNYLHVIGYNSSKAALNSYVVAMACTYPKFKINAITPGYTATKLNGYGAMAPGAKKPEEAAGLIAKYAIVGENSPTGKFLSFHGELGW